MKRPTKSINFLPIILFFLPLILLIFTKQGGTLNSFLSGSSKILKLNPFLAYQKMRSYLKSGLPWFTLSCLLTSNFKANFRILFLIWLEYFTKLCFLDTISLSCSAFALIKSRNLTMLSNFLFVKSLPDSSEKLYIFLGKCSCFQLTFWETSNRGFPFSIT